MKLQLQLTVSCNADDIQIECVWLELQRELRHKLVRAKLETKNEFKINVPDDINTDSLFCLSRCRNVGKDPFMYNASTIDDSGLKAVESQPCASGWCGKSIESSDGEHIIATERMCLQRPPSDNQERCAETFYGNRKKTFFMCFCKGDLCNEATRTSINTITVVLTSLCLLLRQCKKVL